MSSATSFSAISPRPRGARRGQWRERAAGLRDLQLSGTGRAGVFDIFASAGSSTGSSGIASGNGDASDGAKSDAIWRQAVGAWQRIKSDGNAPGLKQDTFGLVGGMDLNPFSDRFPDLKGGISASYTK